MTTSIWQDFVDYMFKTTSICIPTTFHSQVKACKEILKYDYSSLVTTIFDFATNVADVDFKFEVTNNKNLSDILTLWSKNINQEFNGKIPVGIKELAKEYFKERWTSSLIVMNATWAEPNKDGLILPNKIWIMDASGIKVIGDGSTLGDFDYQVKVNTGDGKKYKNLPLNENSSIIVQKPFGRWYDTYPVPYLIRKGTLVSYLMKKALKENSGKVLDEIIPYLILLKKGTEKLFLDGIDYDDEKLKKISSKFKTYLEKKKLAGETGVYTTPFDTELKEFIPDLRKVFAREIYEEIDRDILASMGLIEVIEGVGTTRKEAILNPGPFREEVKQAVEDFKSMLTGLVKMIVEKNKKEHRKWMNASIKVSSTPIKGFFSGDMLAFLRSQYDRGMLSKQTFLELPTNLDYKTELERRIKETEDGHDLSMYPPMIMNREGQGLDIPEVIPEEEETKKEKKKLEKEIKKAGLDITCEVCKFTFDYDLAPEAGMENVYCLNCNSVINKKGEMCFLSSLDPERSLEATLANLVQAPIDITKKYIRIRQKNPNLFQKNSFRTITLGMGIKAIVARLKGQKTTTIQSYLFDKNLWTLKKAKKWIKEHK